MKKGSRRAQFKVERLTKCRGSADMRANIGRVQSVSEMMLFVSRMPEARV